jgi:hypothetical protein
MISVEETRLGLDAPAEQIAGVTGLTQTVFDLAPAGPQGTPVGPRGQRL